MNKEETPKQAFQKILQTKSFEELSRFVDNDFWRSLEQSECHLLAELLVLQGEKYIAENDKRVLDVFKKAREICPDSAEIHYIQGLLLTPLRNDRDYFAQASECFKYATTIDPASFEAWFFWGKLFLQEAELLEDEEMAAQAQTCFFRASECRTGDPELEANLYWCWGMVDSMLGRLHGEAIDFTNALKKLSTAADLGLATSEFWGHYGHIVCELGSLVNRPEAFREGRKYFEKAVLADSASSDAWESLAYCDQKLYEVYGQEDDFMCGCKSFEKAQEYNMKEPLFWERWGSLLLMHGRINFNSDSLLSAISKLEAGHALEPDNPFILGKWAEAEMVYGIYNERIDYLRKAESKVIASLKLQDNNAEMWYVYGTCLNEMGRYFADQSYYFQAIEKFQYGLYLSPNSSIMSQGISLSYYLAGEMKGDASALELSLIYIEKAVNSAKAPPPQLYNDWGVTLMKLADITGEKAYLEGAVDKFEQALAYSNDDSFDPEWLYNYGCALDFLGDFHEEASYYEKAIQLLSKFIQLDPTYLHAHYNLASVYSHLGELVGDVDCFHKAIEHFQKFLSEDSEDEMVWNDYGLTLLNLSDLLYDPSLPNLSQICFAQAEEKFLHAISLGNSQAFYNLACLYSLTRHYTQALHYLEKAEQQRALPPVDEIIDDEWLENLRQTPEFRSFLHNLMTRKHD